jgi:hypothetical protein
VLIAFVPAADNAHQAEQPPYPYESQILWESKGFSDRGQEDSKSPRRDEETGISEIINSPIDVPMCCGFSGHALERSAEQQRKH